MGVRCVGATGVAPSTNKSAVITSVMSLINGYPRRNPRYLTRHTRDLSLGPLGFMITVMLNVERPRWLGSVRNQSGRAPRWATASLLRAKHKGWHEPLGNSSAQRMARMAAQSHGAESPSAPLYAA